MSHDATPDFELLADYLADELPPAQRAHVEQLIHHSPEWRHALHVVQAGWEVARHAVVPPFDLTTIESSVLGRVTSERRGVTLLRPRARVWRQAAVGAATLAAAVAAIVVIRTHQPSATERVQGRTYATAAGQQATVTLQNGSQAILGPATTLSVATDPSDAGMTVTLHGQALFTITHDRRTPLTVRTANTVTRVLGTTFLVREYPGDRVARVMVTEGRVSLQSAANTSHSSTVLVANALGTVDDSGHVRVHPDANTDDYTAWASGRLVFRQTPARDIATDLGRAYGATIRVHDSTLAAQTLTWTVSLTRLTLADAMDAFAAALNAHAVQADSVITIVPGPSPSTKARSPRPFPSSEKQYGR